MSLSTKSLVTDPFHETMCRLVPIVARYDNSPIDMAGVNRHDCLPSWSNKTPIRF